MSEPLVRQRRTEGESNGGEAGIRILKTRVFQVGDGERLLAKTFEFPPEL